MTINQLNGMGGENTYTKLRARLNRADTDLGRHQAVQKREMEASVDVMNYEECQIVRRKLDIMDHSELTVAAL